MNLIITLVLTVIIVSILNKTEYFSQGKNAGVRLFIAGTVILFVLYALVRVFLIFFGLI